MFPACREQIKYNLTKKRWINSSSPRRWSPCSMMASTASHRPLCVTSAQPMLASTRRVVLEKRCNRLVPGLRRSALSPHPEKGQKSPWRQVVAHRRDARCTGRGLPQNLPRRWSALWGRFPTIAPSAHPTIFNFFITKMRIFQRKCVFLQKK